MNKKKTARLFLKKHRSREHFIRCYSKKMPHTNSIPTLGGKPILQPIFKEKCSKAFVKLTLHQSSKQRLAFLFFFCFLFILPCFDSVFQPTFPFLHPVFATLLFFFSQNPKYTTLKKKKGARNQKETTGNDFKRKNQKAKRVHRIRTQTSHSVDAQHGLERLLNLPRRQGVGRRSNGLRRGSRFLRRVAEGRRNGQRARLGNVVMRSSRVLLLLVRLAGRSRRLLSKQLRHLNALEAAQCRSAFRMTQRSRTLLLLLLL